MPLHWKFDELEYLEGGQLSIRRQSKIYICRPQTATKRCKYGNIKLYSSVFMLRDMRQHYIIVLYIV